MGWPNAGNWEGLSIAESSDIVASLCLAINQRENMKRLNQTTYVFNGVETTWPYVGISRPSAADFDGLPFNSPDHKELMESMVDSINELYVPIGGGFWFNGVWVPSVADIWDGESLDLSKNCCDYNNLYIIRRALDWITVARFGTPQVDGTNNATTSVPPYGPGYDIATVWADRFDSPYSGFALVSGVGGYIYWDPSIGGDRYSVSASEYYRTYRTARYLGKLIDCPIAINTLANRAKSAAITQGTNAVFAYEVNGNTVSASSVGFLSEDIPIGTDISVNIDMTTSPDYSGAGSASTSSGIDESAIVTDHLISPTTTKWIYDMSTLLTDQT